ncbi:MAG: glycosyltransferase family 39 protein [Candidatus Hodarchaeota archaeon]
MGTTYRGAEKVPYWENIQIAANLVDGKGYAIDLSMRNYMYFHGQQIPVIEGTRPTALKPPIYPLMVALIFLLFGFKNFFALFLFQAIVSALTCGTVFLHLNKYSRNMAIIGSLGLALYPPFVYHSVTATENTTLLLFLIALFFFYLTRIPRNNSLRNWIITGVVGAILALTEVAAIPFILASLFYLALFTITRNPHTFKNVTASIACFMVVISPWILRNYITFNEFMLFKSGSAQSMLRGLYEAGTGIIIPEETFQRLEMEGRDKNEVQEDNAIKKILIPLIYRNLDTFITVNIPRNFMYFWWQTKKYQKDRSLRYLFGRKLPYILLLTFALPSMIYWISSLIINPRTALRENVRQYLGLILILSFTIPYCIFGATLLRYHFPIQLVMFGFFAETLNYLHSKITFPTESLPEPI